MALFDDINWGNILSGFAQGVPAMITGYAGARGVAKANRRAAEISESNRQANLSEVRASNERASALLRPMASQQVPAAEYLRSIMARSPYELTPQQDIELADRRRIATEMTPSSLRGAGRTVTAISNDVANRGRAGMIAENQRRTDAAAQNLGQSGGSATTNMASIAAGQGPQVANINTGAATDQANALTSTAAMNAKTLGDITSYFASAAKEADRESRYGKARATLEGV